MKLTDIRQLSQKLSYPKTITEQQAFLAQLQELGLDTGKLYQELEMESPLVDTHRDTTYSNTMVSLHSHNFYELLYCENTCGAEYLVGSERYRLQKGDIIFIAPDVSHRPLLPENMAEPYKRQVLWLSAEFLEHLKALFPNPPSHHANHASLLRTAGTKWEYLGDYFHTGVQEAERQAPGWEIAVVGNTVTLLAHLQRAFLDKGAAPMKAEKPELLDQVIAYIESHLAEKITLEDISKRFWVSQSTISQTFRQKMGVSFHRCVTQRRLIAAKTLILQGTVLEDTSEQVGFSDYSTFYRAFKQEYGISPRQFRKLQD